MKDTSFKSNGKSTTASSNWTPPCFIKSFSDITKNNCKQNLLTPQKNFKKSKSGGAFRVRSGSSSILNNQKVVLCVGNKKNGGIDFIQYLKSKNPQHDYKFPERKNKTKKVRLNLFNVEKGIKTRKRAKSGMRKGTFGLIGKHSQSMIKINQSSEKSRNAKMMNKSFNRRSSQIVRRRNHRFRGIVNPKKYSNLPDILKAMEITKQPEIERSKKQNSFVVESFNQKKKTIFTRKTFSPIKRNMSRMKTPVFSQFMNFPKPWRNKINKKKKKAKLNQTLQGESGFSQFKKVWKRQNLSPSFQQLISVSKL